MTQLAIDNDILFKGACYGLLVEVANALPFPGCGYGVLGAARFMLPRRLRKKPPTQGAAAAIEALRKFLDSATAFEPSVEEVGLAARLETEALTKGLQLDAGESLLCAFVIRRNLLALVTGDKRAIKALAAILPGEGGLAKRVYCLEQVFLLLLSSGGGLKARTAVCNNQHVDIALTSCFACSSPEVTEPSWRDGLRSYIENIRSQATPILAAI